MDTLFRAPEEKSQLTFGYPVAMSWRWKEEGGGEAVRNNLAHICEALQIPLGLSFPGAHVPSPASKTVRSKYKTLRKAPSYLTAFAVNSARK